MATISLSRFLLDEQWQKQAIPSDLRLLVEVVARAIKAISINVGKGALAGVLGEAGTGNVQGEAQKKLDVIANEILLEANEWGGHLAAMASEEMEGPHAIPHRFPKGEYLLLFDPLDGSSNIDVNVSVGTIFSVLRCPEGVDPTSEKAFLQPGTQQVCAGFAVFGPSTVLVLTMGHGRALLHARPRAGLLHPHARGHPHPGGHEGVRGQHVQPALLGAARCSATSASCWPARSGPRGKDFNMRWVASMVADVYRILARGGIFMYPRDGRDPGKAGRLRLMYEANPMAMIVEQAGGAATTGRERILDVAPTALHQRVAVFLGSRNEVEVVTRYHAG